MRLITRQTWRIAVCLALLGLVAQTAPIDPVKPPSVPESPPAPAPMPQPPLPDLQDKLDRFAEVVADTITRSHGDTNWRQKTAVEARLTIQFNDQPPVHATVTHEVHRARTRFAVKDGPTFINDGDGLWLSPIDADASSAQFNGVVVPWLIAAPFRLRDRTVQPSEYKVAPVNRTRFDSFKLTFTQHAGENAGDWRVIYSHPRTHLLHAVSNIPLMAALTGKAESTRQCVVMDEYKMIDGVSLATKWTIGNWDNEVQGEPIGTIALTDVQFVIPPQGTFDKPANARNVQPAENKPDSDDAAASKPATTPG